MSFIEASGYKLRIEREEDREQEREKEKESLSYLFWRVVKAHTSGPRDTNEEPRGP